MGSVFMKRTVANHRRRGPVERGRWWPSKGSRCPKTRCACSCPVCTKGYIFTAGLRTADEPGSLAVPQGMHLRINGPKAVMAEIKSHEGSMIEIAGLMKKGPEPGRREHRRRRESQPWAVWWRRDIGQLGRQPELHRRRKAGGRSRDNCPFRR